MTEAIKIKLTYPIRSADGSTEWAELEFPTRFKLKHMRAFPKSFITGMQEFGVASMEAEKAGEPPPDPPESLNLNLWDLAPIIATLCGVDEEAVDELDEDDFEAVSTAVMNFFDSRQQPTGE